MTKQTGTEFTLTSMELVTKVIGSMICNMEQARKAGLMVLFTRASTWPERSTAGACTDGMMAASTRENGPKTKSKALASTHGLMDVSTKENG